MLLLAAIANKMTSVPTTRPPEVSPRTIHTQFCIRASIHPICTSDVGLITHQQAVMVVSLQAAPGRVA